jgi:hypothetical protein
MKLFNWFNPLWLVQNFFTTSLNPITIGAGIGALGSAVQGKSPFTGALLGGGLGGLGSASGLFGSGSGLLSGLKGVATTPVSLGTGGYASGIGGQIIPEVIASAAPIVSTASTVPFGSTEFISPYTKEGIVNFADGTTSTLAPDYLSAGVNYGANAPNFTPVLGKSADYVAGGYGGGGLFGNISDMFGGLSTSDKLGLGLKGFDMMNQPQQQIQPVQVTPITRGNPEAVSAPLFNVAPNVGMQPGNEIGLPNLLTRMPLTDEEKLRLQQLAQYGYRG